MTVPGSVPSGDPGARSVDLVRDTPRPVLVGTGASTWSQHDRFRGQNQLYAAPAGGRRGAGTGVGARDPRGLFAAGFGALALIFTFLPWYQWAEPTLREPIHLGVWSIGYRGWYLLVPAAALLEVLVGVANALQRPGRNWSARLYLTLQLLALTTIGLVVAAMILHKPPAARHPGLHVSISLYWPCLVTLGACLIVVLVTLSSGFRDQDD